MTSILVVDDDPKICRNLSKILLEERYSVKTVTSSKKGLDLTEKKDFDIVIIDLIMPEMEGMELLMKIKRNKPKIHVIMITAFATVENAVEAMKKGASDYVSKPFKTNEIQTTVKRVLEEANFKKRISAVKKSPTVKRIISSLDNSVRREILIFLEGGAYSFSKIMKGIGVEDPTKFNFHLRKLKSDGLVSRNEDRRYFLTEEGKRALEILMQLKES